MKPYLSEWKIYLWKKLLLDQSDPEKIFQLGDFVYFKDEEMYAGAIMQMQRSIDRANEAYRLALIKNKNMPGHQYTTDGLGDLAQFHAFLGAHR